MGKSPMELFVAGGPIMWPMLFLSLVATTVILERLLFAAREKAASKPQEVREILSLAARGELPAAAEKGLASKDFLARILGSTLRAPAASREEEFSASASRELARIHAGLPVLDTVITAAPLLGLLGTVVGMMASFGEISGDLGAPTAITGGIAEALVATACGLLIAISSLLPYNYLTSMAEQARRLVEEAGNDLEVALGGSSSFSAPGARAAAPADKAPPPAIPSRPSAENAR